MRNDEWHRGFWRELVEPFHFGVGPWRAHAKVAAAPRAVGELTQRLRFEERCSLALSWVATPARVIPALRRDAAEAARETAPHIDRGSSGPCASEHGPRVPPDCPAPSANRASLCEWAQKFRRAGRRALVRPLDDRSAPQRVASAYLDRRVVDFNHSPRCDVRALAASAGVGASHPRGDDRCGARCRSRLPSARRPAGISQRPCRGCLVGRPASECSPLGGFSGRVVRNWNDPGGATRRDRVDPLGASCDC